MRKTNEDYTVKNCTFKKYCYGHRKKSGLFCNGYGLLIPENCFYRTAINNLRDRQNISLLMILTEFQKSSESLEVN